MHLLGAYRRSCHPCSQLPTPRIWQCCALQQSALLHAWHLAIRKDVRCITGLVLTATLVVRRTLSALCTTNCNTGFARMGR